MSSASITILYEYLNSDAAAWLIHPATFPSYHWKQFFNNVLVESTRKEEFNIVLHSHFLHIAEVGNSYLKSSL